MNLNVYRKFNFDHARKGAPFSTIRSDTKLLMYENALAISDSTNIMNQRIGAGFELDGVCYRGKWLATTGRLVVIIPNLPTSLKERDLDLVMLPLTYIDGRPVFVDDGLWGPKNNQLFRVRPEYHDFEGCKWPEPKREWIKPADVQRLCSKFPEAQGAFYGLGAHRLANAAIDLAITNKLVVPVEK